MSASREKKQRQNDPAQGLTQKQRKELQEQQAAKRKAILYTVIGVVVAALVVALLVWYSGIFQRKETAVSVNGHDYNMNDVMYYYHNAMVNEYYNTYGTAFDPQQDLKTQYVDEAQTQSYHAYFLDEAIKALTQAAALEDAAAEAGYTLTDEDKATVDEQIDSMKKTAEEGGTNYASYLKMNFGRYMTPADYKACVERTALINGFYNSKAEALELSDEEIQTYYDENASDLKTYEYRYVFVDGSVPETTDSEGNTVEPTEAETAAAMQSAKAKADQFAEALKAADDKESTFAELAPEYVAENLVEKYTEEPDASHYTTVGSSLSSTLASWLKADGRQAGDVDVVESTNGYYVILFLDSYLDETPTVDVRHILIQAELTQEDDPATEDVDESTIPTQEALDAAKAKAEELLAQWESGDKTAESFGALAEANSADTGSNTNGGLYTGVPSGYMFDAFDAWIMDSSRQSGDTTLIENTQAGQQGWHVVYFQDWDDPTWKLTTVNTLKTQQLTEWLDSLVEGLEATRADGLKYVG